MSFRLAASMGALQTLVSMALSFVSIKITSVYLGPAGLGTLGQLTYFMGMTQAVVAAGIGTGLVRRTAELGNNDALRQQVISTVLFGLLLVGAVSSLVVVFGSGWLARELLHDTELVTPLWVFSAVFTFGLVTTVVLSCANGAKDFRTLAFINMGTGIASFVLIATMSPIFGVKGALVATASLPLFSFLIAIGFARRHAWWPKRLLSHGFAGGELPRLMAFVPLSIISAVGVPLVQLLIRNDVVAHDGMPSVGLLQGVTRVSDMYLGVATGILAMYFFPRFSEIREPAELVREMRRGFLRIIPAVATVSLLIYLLRELIVRLVFTADFLPMRDLFGWQMLGNTFKMIGWIFAFVLLAKANAITLAALEIATLSTWWGLSEFFISRSGTLGATKAYAITYVIYSVATFLGVCVVLKQMKARALP